MNGKAEVQPFPAATVTLVRDSARGIEVLMLQRNLSLAFMPGVYVFPGGSLDAADGSPDMQELCAGLDDAAASGVLGIERGGLAFWIAAIREAFEEAGILLAADAGGALVSMRGPAAERYRAHRRAIEEGRSDLLTIARNEGLRFAADRLLYFGHWITPVGAPRRYDTRFFMAIAPEGQTAEPDNHETIAHIWLRPADALDMHRREALAMRFPTIKTLERFAQCSSAAELMATLRTLRVVRPVLPRISPNGESLLPGDPGYEEAGTAEGRGTWKP